MIVAVLAPIVVVMAFASAPVAVSPPAAAPPRNQTQVSGRPAVGGPVSSPAPVCLPAQPAPGLGLVDPFHVPVAAAAQLNADGKVFYRQGRWDDARAKYRAAEEADPDFLAPALNVACSFVRQERFPEAMTEVLRLLDRAYLPWSAEVLSAADLGALKVRAEGKDLRAALDARRLRWAEGLADDLILIARLRAPLKLGDASTTTGALVLGPRQEVMAWSPRTRRFRQLTSEEGRVLAVARSSDGRRIAFVTAEKLIRGPGAALALRGVAITEVDLGTLASIDRAPVGGDVRLLELLTSANGFAYRVDAGQGPSTFALRDHRLEASPARRTARVSVSLTPRGVSPTRVPRGLPAGCAGTVRDAVTPVGTTVVEVKGGPLGSVTRLGEPFGAGLSGLPIP